MFLIACVLLAVGTEKYALVGDTEDWVSADCVPLHETKGARCCARSSSDDDAGDDCLEYGNVPEQWANVTTLERCPGSRIIHQLEQPCETGYNFGAWPERSFSDQFLESGSSFECWTDCDEYLDTHPDEFLLSARIMLSFGYIFFLFCGLCPAIASYQSGEEDGKSFAATILIFNFIFLWYVSTFNCAYHIHQDCVFLQVSYSLTAFGPILGFFLCVGSSFFFSDSKTITPQRVIIGIFVICPVFTCILLLFGIFIPQRDPLEDCWKISWCEYQMWSNFSFYFIVALIPTTVACMNPSKCSEHWEEFMKGPDDRDSSIELDDAGDSSKNQNWEGGHEEVVKELQGRWRNSDGECIIVDGRAVSFLTSEATCYFKGYGANTITFEDNGDVWTLDTTEFGSATQIEWVTVKDKQTWEKIGNTAVMPPTYESANAPPLYDEFSEPTAYPARGTGSRNSRV